MEITKGNKLIYSNNKFYSQWTGWIRTTDNTRDSLPYEQGNYNYLISFTDSSNNSIVHKGKVSLIRDFDFNNSFEIDSCSKCLF